MTAFECLNSGALTAGKRYGQTCPPSMDRGQSADLMMKGQDILLLLKLVSLENQHAAAEKTGEHFSTRALELSTGISKSEVSNALNRCIAAGLAKLERTSGVPRANTRALNEFLSHGLKYVFPVRPGPIVRGLATAHAAPVLAGKLLSGGEHIHVWEDALGSDMGQAIEPLFKSVPSAARQDDDLYAMLALLDAIRLGNEREASLARKLLENYLRGDADGR